MERLMPRSIKITNKKDGETYFSGAFDGPFRWVNLLQLMDALPDQDGYVCMLGGELYDALDNGAPKCAVAAGSQFAGFLAQLRTIKIHRAESV